MHTVFYSELQAIIRNVGSGREEQVRASVSRPQNVRSDVLPRERFVSALSYGFGLSESSRSSPCSSDLDVLLPKRLIASTKAFLYLCLCLCWSP